MVKPDTLRRTRKDVLKKSPTNAEHGEGYLGDRST